MANRLTDLGEQQEQRRQQSGVRRGLSNAARRATGRPGVQGPNTGPTTSEPPQTAAQARTASRVAASGAGSGGKIARLAKGSGRLGAKAVASPAALAIGSYRGALDSYNTPTSEEAKLLGWDEGAPSPDQSIGQQIGGFAKDTAIRSAGTGYDVAQKMGLVGLADAVIPGSNLPRFEHGKYVPGDDVDETTLGDVLGGAAHYVGSGLSALNQGYRRLAGFDPANPAQQPATPTNAPGKSAANKANPNDPAPTSANAQRAPDTASSPDEANNSTQAAPTRSQPAASTSQAVATMPQSASHAIRTTDNGYRYRQSENANGNPLFTDRNADGSPIEQTDGYRRNLAEQGARARANEQLLTRRYQDAAQTFGDISRAQTARAHGQPLPETDPSEARLNRVKAREGDLQIERQEQLQAMRQRIAALSETDPQAAQALAQQYRLLSGQDTDRDRYVKGQQVITTDANGEPLLKPVTADVTYDTRSNRQYGGVPANSGAGQKQVPDKAKWVEQAAQDPRNAGVSRKQIEAAYERKYGS